ncbi:hypothetical protein SKAU_G00244250 [Synaphobranchus kaupii]|uniref:Uncharacterized protein n=1 Tax=Synaphobranchus kaupii TaxID=118154 RepID=A0A9Q1IR83_SYNKA|nr:hypothetical protein SKAU_G00244250 [Synaphobranchus kaupii]
MANFSRGKLLVEMALKRRLQDNEGLLQGQDWAILENFSLTEEDLFPGSLFPEYTSTPDSTLMSAPAPDDLTVPSLPEGEPTLAPTSEPEGEPILALTSEPEGEPTLALTSEPEGEPTLAPTSEPEAEPTLAPTSEPTPRPPLREACGSKCRKKCSEKFSEERRRMIWGQFWSLTYAEKRAFIFHTVDKAPTATTHVCGEQRPSRRARSLVYRLVDDHHVPQRVCKLFYLSTLGYHPNNDSLVFSVIGNDLSTALAPPKDQRGKHVRVNKLDVKPLEEHIESFHPVISHYRREHAPFRCYLPSDITIKLMHSDFTGKATPAPMRPTEKRGIPRNLCHRGNKATKKRNISVVWHEGVAGRSAKEVTSAYMAALQKERDVKHVVYWVDNCRAQNKNWCLLSSLVCVVNSDTIAAEDITLKFFESGHTFMSADSVHHGVELEMKSRPGGVVYDFEDFLSVVGNSNSRKVEVVELNTEGVLDWMDGHSTIKGRRMPKLADMKVVQLRRGSRSMYVKRAHGEEDFIECDVLQKKFSLQIPTTLRPEDKGIEEAKKKDIIKTLCPLMPLTRRQFWSSWPVTLCQEE